MTNPRPIPQKSPRAHARTPGYAIGVVCMALSAAACSPVGRTIAPTKAQSPVSVESVDPTRSVYFSWDPIDAAVRDGAIEYLVVATPEAPVDPWQGAASRTYDLLGPKDQPGWLMVNRAGDDGLFEPGTRSLTITAKIGLFGTPDLESAVVSEIDRLLRAVASDRAGR